MVDSYGFNLYFGLEDALYLTELKDPMPSAHSNHWYKEPAVGRNALSLETQMHGILPSSEAYGMGSDSRSS